MLNSLPNAFAGGQTYASVKRILSSTAMRAASHHQMAFSSLFPHHSRFHSNLRVQPSRRHIPLAPPRRPRARLVPALQTERLNGVVPELASTQAALPRSLVTQLDTGEDGLPIVEEEDLEEQFVRGSGPGGQKINKTASCVVLKHVPTGVMVRCQETRSQTKNRQLARKILQRKLDEMIRGEESLAARELSRARARKAKRRRKSIKKHFKSRRDKAFMDSRMADF